MVNETNESQTQPEFKIERLYTKNLSLEIAQTIISPNSQPEIKLEIGIQITDLREGHYEVLLSLTATVKYNGTLACIAKVQQGGSFQLNNYNDTQERAILHVTCPHILYPYACERIANIALHGGYPLVHLIPIDFNNLHQHELQHEKNKKNDKKTEINEKELSAIH